MEDWLEILKEEENKKNNYQQDDYIELPEPEIIDLNDDGTLRKEITYEYDDNDKNIIYRIERVIQIENIQQKISQSAIDRKRRWIKFGQVANIPKGQIERGVTSQRQIESRNNFNKFIWTGMKTKKQSISNNNQSAKPSKYLPMQQREEEKKNDYNDTASVQSGWTMKSNHSGSKLSGQGGYRLSKDRMTELLGEPVEIKISNLPQWTTWDNIKRLIDAFYIHHLQHRYPPKYKIRMIPSKWTLEKWNADPITYKHKLEDYERMAIVEFDNDKNAQKAIKILNGHRYEYCVLCVEKARPRNNNNSYYTRSR